MAIGEFTRQKVQQAPEDGLRGAPNLVGEILSPGTATDRVG